MASRFNTLLGPQPYISTYVPLPLDSLMKAGAMKQKQFDDAVDDAYKMQDLMKTVKAIDKHQPYKKQLEEKYYPKIEELADEIVKTGDVSKARDVNRLARQWQTDPLRQELEQSYANYEAYQKDKIAKGEKYGEWYDPYLPFTGSNEDQSIAGFRYTGMGEVQDHQKLALDMMDKIKEDARGYDNVSLDQSGNIVGRKGKESHILSDKVRGLARGKTDSFLLTKEGKDFATMIKYNNPSANIKKAAEEYLYQAGANQIFKETEYGNSFDYAPEYISKKLEEEQLRTYETALSQLGSKGVADLSEVANAEPQNSILSKIISFADPNNQAKGLLNMIKVFSPSLAATSKIAGIDKKFSENAKINEDEINKHIEEMAYEMKQQIAKDQKSFRETFGFGNPVFDQTYTLLDVVGKGKDIETNSDYERAKQVMISKDPNFRNLTKQEQFETVTKAMTEFQESSKLNNVSVTTDPKELNFRNAQLANVTGTPAEQTKQLMALGVASNGRFIDFFTQKEIPLEEVVKHGQIKYIGQLDNQNQAGPAMDYYQAADGTQYLSPGSLEDRKANYLDWAINQVDNRFSKRFETPISFDASRDSRNFESDGVTPKKGIPKLEIERDLKTNELNVVVNIPDPKTGRNITIKANKAPTTEAAKEMIGIQLIQAGYTADQVLNLGL